MTAAEAPRFGEGDSRERLGGRVELTLPARPDLLFLARMTAAAVASRADFGYDQIEDLRLALDELCLTLLVGRHDDVRVQLRFGWQADTIEVVATLDDHSAGGVGAHEAFAAAARANEFSERILDALVDEHGIEERDGTRSSWLRMHRREVG